MFVDPGKCVGRMVEMIYMDGEGRITQRCVRVQAVRPLYIQAYCLEREAPRSFRRENVLSLLPLPLPLPRRTIYGPHSA